MNREARKRLVQEIAVQLSNSGIRIAQGGDVGVEPGLKSLDEFMTEYLQMQTDLVELKGLIKYCLGPTRDVKTPKLVRALELVTEMVDADG